MKRKNISSGLYQYDRDGFAMASADADAVAALPHNRGYTFYVLADKEKKPQSYIGPVREDQYSKDLPYYSRHPYIVTRRCIGSNKDIDTGGQEIKHTIAQSTSRTTR